MRRMMILAFAALALLSSVSAQVNMTTQTDKATPFTAEDTLKVVTLSIADLSDDGARVAVALRRAYDNAEVDNYRYGDPTYIAPARAQLLVVDTETEDKQTPFGNELVNFIRAAWSHDSKRLAILLSQRLPGRRDVKTKMAATAPGGPALYIWDAMQAALTEVLPRPEVIVSTNSGLEWTADDARLVVTLRAAGWAREAAERFKHLTAGPIIVQSSKEPFLEWDGLQRSARKRILANVDVRTGEATRLLPELNITSYNLARDGSFATFLEDVTEKTDYDEIRGDEQQVDDACGAGPPYKRCGAEDD